jgi:glycosyltransferase involved in cell wall biosynthesis
MNILFLDQFSELGGAQLCLLELLQPIRDRGWQALVAAPGVGPLRELALALGAAYRPIHLSSYESGRKSASDVFRFASELPFLAKEIAGLVREFGADVVYVNGPRLLPAARLAAPERLVFHCHSFLNKRYAAALAGLAANGATVIANCHFVAAPLAPYVTPIVVYNGVLSNSIEPERKSFAENGCVTVGVLGRIAPEKGHLDLMHAARLLGPGFRFLVCGAPLFSGDGYYERVRAAANGLPVAFLGWRDDAAAVLAGLDILAVPSAKHEATTRVILEAYAAGVPVIASDSGGIPEIVVDGETGFLVPPGDPAKLARKISEAAANPPTLRKISDTARELVRERYSLHQYQGRVMSILERVGASALT